MSSTEQRTRVVVVEDHPIYRQGLTDAIKRRPDLELIGEAETGARALEELKKLKPDVAVLDMKLPDLDGIEIMRAVMRDKLETRILFLSAYLEGAKVYQAMEGGACGYLSKDCDAATVCDAVSAVARGEMVLGPETHTAIGSEIRHRAPGEPSPLSKREREILSLTAGGHSASDIATRLYLSPATVKTHLHRTYHKLGVSDRAAAVAEAMRIGLVE